MRTQLPVFVLLAALAPAWAQVASAIPALASPDLLVPIHTHHGGDDPTYGSWACGPRYKVSFHDGFTFYPLLGDAYPENLPLRWRATQVAVGSQSLAAPAAAVHRRTAWRYEYDHGVVTEAYDVRADGVEQSFVIAARPAAAGDLVISGQVDTPLRCAPVAAAHRALTFCDAAGNAVVRYGNAVAIDARGDRTDVRTGWDGTRISLHVAGDWLARALFPILVDPLTSTVLISTSTTSPVASCDVGQQGESAARNVVFAIERSFSATDHDVQAYVCDLDFTNRALIMSDLTTANDDRNVTVAFVAGADRWLVGFERGYTTGGNAVSTIRVYFHDKGNAALNSGVAFSIPQLFVEFFRSPDLGGTFLDSNGVRGLLVYTRDPTSADGDHTSVVAVPIDASTRTFLSAYQVGNVTVGTTYDRQAPSVNQTSGQGDGWVIVYQELDRTIANDEWDVYATRTDAAGAKTAASYVTSSGGSQHFTTPQVSGMHGHYMLTFTASADLASTAGAQLRSARVSWALGAPGPAVGAHNVLATASPPLATLRNHGLALNHFIGTTSVATWTRTSILGLSASRSATAGRLTGGGALVDAHTLFAASEQSALSPAVTFAYPGERYAIVYGTTESAAQNVLHGRQYLYPADAGEFRYGVGCGPAVIDGHRPYLGNEHYTVGCAFAPASVPAALLVGLAPGSVPLGFLGMTGCVLNLDLGQLLLSLPGTSSATGSLRIPMPLPESVLTGYDLYFQVAYGSPGANPAHLQATQGLRAQVR